MQLVSSNRSTETLQLPPVAPHWHCVQELESLMPVWTTVLLVNTDVEGQDRSPVCQMQYFVPACTGGTQKPPEQVLTMVGLQTTPNESKLAFVAGVVGDPEHIAPDTGTLPGPAIAWALVAWHVVDSIACVSALVQLG
jgi:hypothetical protein